MAVAAAVRPAVQRPLLVVAGCLAAILFVLLLQRGTDRGLLFLVGLGLGFALHQSAFGFTAAYRRAILKRDLSGVTAQMVMLGLAMLLFAPALAAGEILGRPVSGAVAPVDAGMLIGAFVFGIGMQLGGGCASGTLFAAGGGSVRMVVVLVFFCAGGFLATLHMGFWEALPSFGAVALGLSIGWAPAVAAQLGVLAAVWLVLHRLWGARMARPLWPARFGAAELVRGPWPLLLGGIVLAAGNFAVLWLNGYPWGITWGFTLWAAKLAAEHGWGPWGSAWWAEPWRRAALDGPLLADSTSVTNIAILAGAAMAGALAGTVRPTARIALRPLAAAVLGGLMLGYGARLAYGCNIGAFFSGVASTSLHGWAWIAAAVAGNLLGVRVRPWFRLDG